jgi:hypothetical protein
LGLDPCNQPASSAASAATTTTTASLGPRSSAPTAISAQALLSAGAVGAGIATLPVVAEGALAGAPAGFLAVTALRRPGILIDAIGPALVLVKAFPALIEVGLSATSALLPVLSQISLVVVSILRLIVLLVELRGSVVAIEVVGPVAIVAVIIPVDVIGVEIVPVNVIGIDIVCSGCSNYYG